MALIIGPQRQSFGSNFGQGLGQGLSQGVEGLIASKLGELGTNKLAKEYASLGMNPAEAKVLARLGPKERGDILQEYFTAPGQGGNFGGQPSSVGVGDSSIGSKMKALSSGAPQQQLTTPHPTQMMLNGLNPLQMNKALMGQGAAPQIQPVPVQQQAQQFPVTAPRVGTQAPGQIPGQAPAQATAPVAPQRPLSIAEAKRQRQAERDIREAAVKETADFRKELEAKSRTAKQTLRDLDRMEELEKTGKLDTPGYVEFLKRSGLEMPALMNPETEEYQKLSYGFMRNAKEIFGSRISNFEIDQFLKTIPSLSQSPEGRKRVIANLKYLNRAAVEYNETKKEIMRENRNVPPIDLADQIDDRMDKKLDNLAERFRKDLAKPVPKGQNKFITALQATAGSTIGNLPKAASGAVAGAGLGALVGGAPGAVIGGISGGLAGLGGVHVNPKAIASNLYGE